MEYLYWFWPKKESTRTIHAEFLVSDEYRFNNHHKIPPFVFYHLSFTGVFLFEKRLSSKNLLRNLQISFFIVLERVCWKIQRVVQPHLMIHVRLGLWAWRTHSLRPNEDKSGSIDWMNWLCDSTRFGFIRIQVLLDLWKGIFILRSKLSRNKKKKKKIRHASEHFVHHLNVLQNGYLS